MAWDVRGRLDRLERQNPAGCPTCRSWPTALDTAEDGRLPSAAHPAQCPACGRRRRIYVRERAHSFDYVVFERGFQAMAASESGFADRCLQE